MQVCIKHDSNLDLIHRCLFIIYATVCLVSRPLRTYHTHIIIRNEIMVNNSESPVLPHRLRFRLRIIMIRLRHNKFAQSLKQ